MLFQILKNLVKIKFEKVNSDGRKLSKKVRKVIFCSGKIYYDLIEAVSSKSDVMINRVEQLYPFPVDETKKNLIKT